jgi:hypothetical protein
MNLKKVLILILAVLILAVSILILAKNISNKEQKNKPTPAPTSTSTKTTNPTEPIAEKQIVVPDAKSILRGKITQVAIQQIAIMDANKNEVKLNIPEKNVKFYQETKLDKSITLKEIGLLDIKINSKVEIEYNPENGNVNFIKVLVE